MISLDTALSAARATLATVASRADRQGYYAGARTDLINSHAELRAALDMLIKAAERRGAGPAGQRRHQPLTGAAHGARFHPADVLHALAGILAERGITRLRRCMRRTRSPVA